MFLLNIVTEKESPGLVYLVQCLGIKKHPAELNNLCRILSHIHAMFIARSRNVNNDIAIGMRGRRLLTRHVCKIFRIVLQV